MKPLLIAAAALLAGFAPADAPKRAEAYFAMGCFWCGEADMEKVPGVIEVTSGYTGGTVANPTYEQVSAGVTGHYEAVKVVYDPSKLSYARLLDEFWRNIDPFDPRGQFCDKGSSYRAAIFPLNAAQRKLAKASKARVEAHFGRSTAVTVADMTTFYDAESYHQDYYRKNPIRYRLYRGGCGRDARLKEVWGG
jgi:peptide-methionine (S)-S-oxide reductase